jgi:cyclic-di-GMP-binding protein
MGLEKHTISKPRETTHIMAKSESFDVTTGVDLQEADNAINQAMKEISQRYDFKNLKVEIILDRKENKIQIDAPDEFKLKDVWDILVSKMIKRGVPTKNMHRDKVEIGSHDRARQTVNLVQGLDADTTRKVAKMIKDAGLKKIQVAIQGDQVRVTGPSRDDLQQVIQMLRAADLGVELKFGNYRSN